MTHLKELRQRKRMTQTALHMATGIDQSLLSKYERGERIPSSADLMLLADYFHTSTDYLLERTDVAEAYPRKGKG